MCRPQAGASRLLCGFWTWAHAFLKPPYSHLTTCISSAAAATLPSAANAGYAAHWVESAHRKCLLGAVAMGFIRIHDYDGPSSVGPCETAGTDGTEHRATAAARDEDAGNPAAPRPIGRRGSISPRSQDAAGTTAPSRHWRARDRRPRTRAPRLQFE